MRKLGVFILTINPNFESTPLYAFLISCKDFHVFIVDGFKPVDLGCRDDCLGHGTRAKISCVEFAVAEGHRKMRILARQTSYETFLFLEDDAIVNCSPELLLDLHNQLLGYRKIYSTPAIHLFPEQNGLLVEIKFPFLRKIIVIPDYAVSYLMTLEALESISKDDSDVASQIADWPNYIKKLDWFATEKSYFIHPDIRIGGSRSTTKTHRSFRQGNETKREKFLNPRSYMVLLLPVLALIGRKVGQSPIEAENLRSVCLRSHIGNF
jgi:hypothetical protein